MKHRISYYLTGEASRKRLVSLINRVANESDEPGIFDLGSIYWSLPLGIQKAILELQYERQRSNKK